MAQTVTGTTDNHNHGWDTMKPNTDQAAGHTHPAPSRPGQQTGAGGSNGHKHATFPVS